MTKAWESLGCRSEWKRPDAEAMDFPASCLTSLREDQRIQALSELTVRASNRETERSGWSLLWALWLQARKQSKVPALLGALRVWLGSVTSSLS